MNALKAFDERLPSEIDMRSADQLRKILASAMREDADTELSLVVSKNERAKIVLTHSIAETFMDVLRLISSGQGFQLIPHGAELTTQEAADLLNVSRPFLIKLLDKGEIDFGLVGRHRRIKAQALFEYKNERDNAREKALSDMAQLDAAIGAV